MPLSMRFARVNWKGPALGTSFAKETQSDKCLTVEPIFRTRNSGNPIGKHMSIFTTISGLDTAKLSVVALALASSAGVALAGPIPYPSSGTPNSTTYTFTAAATGDVIAYFAGSGASYDEQVGMLDNGVLTAAGFGLDDHSSVVGQSFDFGPVTAGDTLVFVDHVFNTAGYVYSDPSLNVPYDIDGSDGHNHVYSTSATLGQVYAGSPAGTYVAFEDLKFPDSDFNYFDDTFIFTDVSTVTNTVPDGVPTLALLGLGVAGICLLRRRVLA